MFKIFQQKKKREKREKTRVNHVKNRCARVLLNTDETRLVLASFRSRQPQTFI
jgi:hypothetical protein